jgi:hypothetical protein
MSALAFREELLLIKFIEVSFLCNIFKFIVAKIQSKCVGSDVSSYFYRHISNYETVIFITFEANLLLSFSVMSIVIHLIDAIV